MIARHGIRSRPRRSRQDSNKSSVAQPFRAARAARVVRTFRSARDGRPEGLHYKTSPAISSHALKAALCRFNSASAAPSVVAHLILEDRFLEAYHVAQQE